MTIPAPRPGPSLFLGSTALQLIWDPTSISCLKECPRKYQLSIIEGWRGKGKNVHFEFGGWYAKALQHYHQVRAEGMSHDDALEEVVAEALLTTWINGAPWDSGHDKKTRFTLIRTIVWYLDLFENDPAKTLVIDGKPAVELRALTELDFGPECTKEVIYGGERGETYETIQHTHFSLCGLIDRMIDFDGHLYVQDQKTTGMSLSQQYYDQFEPNDQMTAYTILGRIAFHISISGVMIDAAQVLVGHTKFARGMTYRTVAQMEEWLKGLEYWFGQAEKFVHDNFWPMNESACSGKFGSACQFRGICSKDPSVRDNFLRTNFTQDSPWNPLLPR